jgi:hypothetical protein
VLLDLKMFTYRTLIIPILDIADDILLVFFDDFMCCLFPQPTLMNK